jgi:hypothetical protein
LADKKNKPVSELEEDGYVTEVDTGGNRKVLQMTDWDSAIEYSEFVYSPRLPKIE